MKNTLALCGALLVLSASVVSAAGINIRWDNCAGDGGTLNKNFACNTNAGSSSMRGSFSLNTDLVNTSGEEIVIDLASDGAVLPIWWQFKNPGTCRQTALTMATNQPGTNCPDWGELGVTGGIGAYNIGNRGPNTARIVAAAAVPGDALKDLFADQEYYAFSFNISNTKTVGTGACAGCQTPVCIVFVSLNVTTPIAANNRRLSNPANGTDSNFCTWQGGGNPNVGGQVGCPRATPTRSSTWGQVKGLYR